MTYSDQPLCLVLFKFYLIVYLLLILHNNIAVIFKSNNRVFPWGKWNNSGSDFFFFIFECSVWILYPN